MTINKMPLLSDPFDETKKLINDVVDKLEQTYSLMTPEQFTAQTDKIEKDIKLLATCVTRSSESPEKAKRSMYIKNLEQRVNNIRTLFLTRTVKSGQSGSNFASGAVVGPNTNSSNSDTQQLLVRQMINEQDTQLELISRSVVNLKQMADTIGNEVVASNRIIDEITVKVEETDGRLNYTTKAIKRLNQKMKNSCCCKTAMIIGAVIVIFVVVLACVL